jgi:hypothetical protein
MITAILALGGTLFGGASLVGIGLKVAGWFGFGFGGSGIFSVLAHLCVKLIDLAFWLLQGALRLVWHTADYLSRDLKAAVVVGFFVWGGYLYGDSGWRYAFETVEPPAKSSTAKASKRKVAVRKAKPSIVSEIDGAVRRALGGAY